MKDNKIAVFLLCAVGLIVLPLIAQQFGAGWVRILALQVSGRSDAGTKGMEMWDPYYVRNWSLWLDAIILIRTVRTVLTGAGAY
jgi:hypothetical protein